MTRLFIVVALCLAVSGCTSSTTAGSPSVGRSSTSTSTSATPSTSPSSAPSSAPPVTSARAKELVSSATHVDAENFQTGSYDPSTPAQRMEHVIQFTTPSGNIRCTMVEGSPSSIICDIAKYDFTPPTRPSNCTLNWATQYVSLTDKSARIGLCVGGVEVTYNSNVLPYDRAIEALGIGCYSASSALTCVVMSTGHGFSLNRSAFITF